MIYLDSCIVIYAVEDDGARGMRVRERLAASGDEIVAVSGLVTMECLVGPLRAGDLGLRDHYERALRNFERLPVGEAQFIRAAELRAQHGLGTPDALHLAIAQSHGCDELWTNDTRLAAAAHGLALDVVGSD